MPKSQRQFKEYEREIFNLKMEELTHRQIGDGLGFTKEHIREFLLFFSFLSFFAALTSALSLYLGII